MTIKEILGQCEFVTQDVFNPFINLKNGVLRTSLSHTETHNLKHALKELLTHYDEKHPFALDREEIGERGGSLYSGYGNDGPIVEAITLIIEDLNDISP